MSRSDLRERPPSGLIDWPNNGEIYERMRVDLLARAGQAEAAGDVALGEELRERASFQKRERDRCFTEWDRRRVNQHLAAERMRSKYGS